MRVDAAGRVVAASPQEVYAAFTDPAAWLSWLPPTGMTARIEHFDLRVGGRYRLVLTYDRPDPEQRGKTSADSDVVEGRFVELVPGERVVQEVDFSSDDPSYAGTMRMTWSVATHPDGTEVRFRAEDVPTGISPEDHRAGLRASLANLADHLG